jgi:hypothetical protein
MSENTTSRPAPPPVRPEHRGHVPGRVQGGYQPSTSQHGKPPTGGSAVKPQKK